MPGAAAAVAFTVAVAALPELTDVGEKETVTPEGNPLAEKEIVSADPVFTAVVSASVAELPSVTVSEAEPAASVKSFDDVEALPAMHALLTFDHSF